MESVYIETSVVSYLVARPSREPVTAWRQQLTKEWWLERRGLFACVISQEVIAEALEGDASMVAKRMAALRDLPLIAGGVESAKLAADLLERGLFPAIAWADANHLAVATCTAVDYLLTWNYRHLANAQVLHRLENYLGGRGLHLPRVCTPEELMGI
ncbi:MAG: type II toxin-antitoxin system VapC family toxin [Verrucomicrobiota bacterium]|jgi:hypothetical protein